MVAGGQTDGGIGVVVVFDAESGAIEATLETPDPDYPRLGIGDLFGFAVTTTDEYVAVSAPGTFSVYVYAPSGALLQSIVFPEQRCCVPLFGRTVAVQEDVLAVGGEPQEVHLYSISAGVRIGGLRPAFASNGLPIRESTFGEDAIAAANGLLFVGDEASETIFAFDVASRQQVWARTLPFLRLEDVPPTGLSGVGLTIAVDGDDVVVGGTRRNRRRVLGYRLDAMTGRVKDILRGKGGLPKSVAISDALIVTGTDRIVGLPGRVNIFRRGRRRTRRLGALVLDDRGRWGRAVAAVGRTVVVSAPEFGAVFGFARE